MLPLDGFDHGSIVQTTSSTVTEPLVEALSVDDDGWAAWCAKTQSLHDDTIAKQHKARDEHRHAYQNTVLRVRDEFGHPVPDYLLETELKDSDQGIFSRFFQSDAIDDVHVYQGDPSYRSLLVNVTKWQKRVDKESESVEVTIAASPQYKQQIPEDVRPVDKRRFNVGFEPKMLTIPQNQLDQYFAPNRTMLVEVVLPRRIDPGIVRIDPLEDAEKAYRP
jgi:hypothetical protein